jgi:hypothetical protein
MTVAAVVSVQKHKTARTPLSRAALYFAHVNSFLLPSPACSRKWLCTERSSGDTHRWVAEPIRHVSGRNIFALLTSGESSIPNFPLILSLITINCFLALNTTNQPEPIPYGLVVNVRLLCTMFQNFTRSTDSHMVLRDSTGFGRETWLLLSWH